MEKKDLENGMFVELANGDKGIIVNNTIVYQHGKWSGLEYFNDNLTHRFGTGSNIIKVYDTKCYDGMDKDTLIWERPIEILDKVEKEYLSNIVRPFRDKVRHIRKGRSYNDFDFIIIVYKNDEYTYLPNFEIGSMYKGMDYGKNYTLEDLGL